MLSSDYAVSIDVEDTSTIEGVLQLIIKANNNLTESNAANDWAQMGRDIEELQRLVRQLETLKKAEDAKNDIGGTRENTNTIQNINVLKDNNVIVQ